ncbi:MAG: 50S ribosomal protein L10 [Anaerolineae bacterium]|nr:50S ribosomal protein L10 [Anaerolineae bacterium]
MPVSKARKSEQLEHYNELLRASNGFAVLSTNALPVSRVQNLRRKIREAGGTYLVAKNTMIIKALEHTGWVVPADILKGQTAIVFGRDNFPGVAKALLNFLETEKIEEDRLKVVGGVMGTDILNAAGVKLASELPTLPELQAQIIGLIVAPATGLASVLEAATGGMVNFLQALEDKLKENAA